MAQFIDDMAKESGSEETELSECESENSIPYQGHMDNSVLSSISRKRTGTTSTSTSSSGDIAKLLLEMKKTNELISNMAKKMKRQVSRLKVIETQLATSSSARSEKTTPRSSRQKNVPTEVRVSVFFARIDINKIKLDHNILNFPL